MRFKFMFMFALFSLGSKPGVLYGCGSIGHRLAIVTAFLGWLARCR